MIKRIKDKYERINSRRKRYSNPLEIIICELMLKDRYKVEIKDLKFLVRWNRGDEGVLTEIFFREDYKSYDFHKFDTIIDVGAHIGGFSLKFSDSAEQIYSYEPNTQTFNLLEENLEINNAENVEALNMAVSSEKGDVKLFTNSNSLRSSLEIREEGHRSEIVKKASLKSIVEKKQLIGKTLLKLDCEGSEFNILMETNRETLNQFDAIFLEWHRNAGDPKNLEQRLEDIGFNIEKDREERNIENNVGFIYAKLN